MTKLYLFEGLPCSGKSTTAKAAARQLEEAGKQVLYFDEGTGNHPADYEFHSCLDAEALQSLDASLREKVLRQGHETRTGFIVPLSDFSQEELQVLLPYKIYDFLPWEREKPLMLERWKEFVQRAMAEDTIYVFNCVFLQNPMCETMMRFDFSPDASFSYICQLRDIIRPLNPKLVYLKNDSIADSVLLASREREGWLDSVIDYHVHGGYGRRVGAQGFGGYIACLEERQRRELDILKRLGIPALILDNPQENWRLSYEKIRSFLD